MPLSFKRAICDPCCGPAPIPGCFCPSGVPQTLRLLDPKFGIATLSWDAANLLWYACKEVSTFGVSDIDADAEGPVTTRLVYRLTCAGRLFVHYRGTYTPLPVDLTGAATNPNFFRNNWPVDADCILAPGTEDQEEDPGFQRARATDIYAIDANPFQEVCSPHVCLAFNAYDVSRTRLVPLESGICDGFSDEFYTGYIDPDEFTGLSCIGTLHPYHGIYGTQAWDDPVGIVIYDPAAPPPPPTSFCIRAHRPDCGETAGAAVVGATVEVRRFGEETVLFSGTTNAEGKYCPALTEYGVYAATITDSECDDPIVVGFVFGPCSGVDPEVDVTICCATACVLVIDDVDDSPIIGAEVDFGSFGVVETDAGGIACIDLTSAQMLALPLAEGGGCSDRVIQGVEITRPADPPTYPQPFLSRCGSVPVSCGSTGSSPAEFRMAEVPPGYFVAAELYPGIACCPDDGCTTIGPPLRGLVPTEPDIAYEVTWKDALGVVVATGKYEGTIPLDSGSAAGLIYRRPCAAVTIAPTIDCGGMGGVWGYVKIDLELCKGGPGTIRSRWYEDPGCNTGTGTDFPTCLDSIDVESTLDDEVNQTAMVCYALGLDCSWTDALPGGQTIEHHLVVVGP